MTALHRPLARLAAALLSLAAPALAAATPKGGGGGEAQAPAGSMNVVLKDGTRVPLFGERTSRTAVAKVDGEVISVRDLGEAIAGAHEGRAPGEKAAAPDASQVLARLVNVRLIAAEAHAMGLDELPEFKKQIFTYTEAVSRDLLRRQAASRAKADPAAVERAFQDAVREWKVSAVLFDREADAKAFQGRLAAPGASFDAAAARALEEKQAKAHQRGEFLPEAKLLPEVAATVRKVPQGAVSGVVGISGGFALLRVDGIRYPESAEAREAAAAKVRNDAQVKAVAGYTADLLKRHAAVDRKLLAALDFDAKDAPLEALGKDRRVLARVDGKPAMTVADLATALEAKFFHGAKQAAERKRVNKEKQPVVDGMLAARVLWDEARRKGLDRSEEARYLVRERRHELLFSAMLERVILPEVKVGDADLKAYYDAHGRDFTFPAMYRLEGLAFASAVGAEDAAKKLRSGTDLAWLRSNAEGQLDPARQKLQLGGVPLDQRSMPPAAAAALASAKAGDSRTFVHEGEHYVVRVVDVTPPRRQPLEDVRDEVQKRVFAEKAEASLASWVEKLRAHYPVEVYLASVG